MSEKDSALGQLNAMKARYAEGESIANGEGDRLASQPRRLLTPHYWRAGAILLAVFCGVFLSLAYRESKGLSRRHSQLQVIESRLADSENHLMTLSTEIGTMTAQKESLTSELIRLRSEAAKSAESSAENRILGKALPPLKSEYSELVSKVASLRESKAELEGQVRSAEKKLADVRAVIETQERALKKVSTSADSKQKRLVKIERELADKQTAVTGAQRSLLDYSRQIKTVERDYENLKKRLASMNDERDQVTDTIRAKQADLNSARADYNKEKSRLDLLSAELKRLNNSLLKDQKRIEVAENRRRSLSDEVSALEAKKAQLSAVLAELRKSTRVLTEANTDISIKNIRFSKKLQ